MEILERFRKYRDGRERSETLRSRFTTVYDQGLWGVSETRSGFGSEKGSQWVTIAAEAIRKAVSEHGVRSIDDIPCGDFNWMPDVLAGLGPVRYIGFDIVFDALARNKERFPQYEFRVLDITAKVPPAADLIFCKDLLNHLTDADVKRAIANMRRSGSKFLLASNNPGFENTPLPETPGGSRHLDITAPPFHLPPPLWSVADYMSLWRLADLTDRAP
jgi:hypothetical protein